MTKALRRHKITVSILLLQFAVAFALLSNAAVLVWQRFEGLRSPSGMVEEHLAIASFYEQQRPVGFPSSFDSISEVRETIALAPGVVGVSAMNQTPFAGINLAMMSLANGPAADAERVSTSTYFGDPNMGSILGLQLLSGRWFSADEYRYTADSSYPRDVALVIVTKQLASKLFPHTDPLGKTLYNQGTALTIIGVVSHLPRPAYQGEITDDSAMIPVLLKDHGAVSFAFRIDPKASDPQVIAGVRAALTSRATPSLHWQVQSFAQQRAAMFAQERGAFRILIAILVALLVVAGNAIAGVCYYWVEQRAAHVATRRALVAMRRQILQFFLFENLLLCIAGVLLGVFLTLSLNTWLVVHFGAARLPLTPLLTGFTLAAVVGQLAVSYPAWRIGRLSPGKAARL